MKNLVFALTAVAAMSLFAGIHANPYAGGYGKAMASEKGDPMAAEWQGERKCAIAAATEEGVLAAFVADEASAKALLDQLKPAYATCPMVMTQIAAVTQWVMLPEPFFLWFWQPSPAAGRAVWTKALEAKIAATNDDYIRTFCRQQLDLCK